VQAAIGKFFKTFVETSSATATVKQFRRQGLKFPRKLRRGARQGDVVWGELVHSRALQLLHNPRYAGAFFFGRSRQFKKLPPDQWHTLLLDAHVGYISWEQFQKNQQQLSANAQALGVDRRKSPPGEGCALLQGIIVCGRCGKRMTVRYDHGHTNSRPRYMCQRDGIEQCEPVCQSIPGQSIDAAIEQLLLKVVTPLAMEVTLAVQSELQTRLDEANALRKQQVDRARYEAELARSRFMQVDPNNRLVADSLEGDWNDKLRAVAEAQETYEQHIRQDATVVDDSTRSEVLELATNFPKLWSDPRTSFRDRKKIVRLLIDDVTLNYDEQITAHVRFKGGMVQSLQLTRPLAAWELRQTSPELIATIDRLLDDLTEAEIAEQLNRDGQRSSLGSTFTGRLVGQIRRAHNIPSRYVRLRKAGMLTQAEIAEKLSIHPCTVRHWRDAGLLKAHAYNDKNESLYAPIPANQPIKLQGLKLNDPRRIAHFPLHCANQVQHEA
jgi:hypothetical protein